MKPKTFDCECGHAAYYIPRRGWCCMCNNPKRKNKKEYLRYETKKVYK